MHSVLACGLCKAGIAYSSSCMNMILNHHHRSDHHFFSGSVLIAVKPLPSTPVEFSKSVLLQLSSLLTISFNDYNWSSVMIMINEIIAVNDHVQQQTILALTICIFKN